MTIVSSLTRHRRVLFLGAATVALHYAAIDWVGGRLSAQTHRASDVPPSLMTAQLRLALPKRVESAPAPEVKPLAQHAPKPVARPKPPPLPEPAPLPMASTPSPDVPALIAAEPDIAVAAAPGG
ncbi:DUF3108 domain-containing protein, partial [Pseudoduganella sp. FT25W]|nr:DUF3108 domain-containing protein [Duganella alba]